MAITSDEKKFFAQVDGLVGIEMAEVAARKMIHRVPAEVPPELAKIGSRSHVLGVRPGDKEVWDCDVERKVVHVTISPARSPSRPPPSRLAAPSTG